MLGLVQFVSDRMLNLNRFEVESPTSRQNHQIIVDCMSILLFLGQGVRNTLIGHRPCLFARHSPIKDIQKVMESFCCIIFIDPKNSLNIMKALGIEVSYCQTKLHEIATSEVTKIEADLKDGVRLARLFELLQHTSTLGLKLQLPEKGASEKFIEKINNINCSIILKVLGQEGLSINRIDASDISSGKTIKIFSLLYTIIYEYQLLRLKRLPP